MKLSYSMHVPLLLTFIRLIVAPIILPFLLVYILPLGFLPGNIAVGILFALFSITDFFDGYFARKYGQVTRLGKLLDPIADKFLCFSTFIALLVVGKIAFYWVLIIIGRDLCIMSLRLLASEHNFSVPVSWLGKLKTAIQLVYLTVAIINPIRNPYPLMTQVETILLVLVLISSVGSAYAYYKTFMRTGGEQIFW